jgi:hypothetical protein
MLRKTDHDDPKGLTKTQHHIDRKPMNGSHAKLTHVRTRILLPAPHSLSTFSHYRIVPITSQSSPIPHSLKALLVRLMHFHAIEIDAVFPAFCRELARVEHAVAAAGFDHVGLLLEGEVAPGEGWGDDGTVQGEDFVVGYCAGVGELGVCQDDGRRWSWGKGDG